MFVLLASLFLMFFGSATIFAQTPVITSQPASATVTLGSTVTFSVAASGASRYQWQRDGTNVIAGATSSAYTFTPTVADSGHIFNVVVYSASGGAAGSASAWLHVIPRTDIPTVTNVENFGVINASQAADSFGLGVDSTEPWEFAAIAAMGGKWARADGCQWEHIEIQTSANTSGGFAPGSASACLDEVISAAQNGLHLDALSYFAPPSMQVATATVAAAVPAGSTVLPLKILSGSISGYTPQSLLIYGASGLNSRIDYGAPVHSVSGSTLTLPEPSIAAIPANTAVTINVLLYPPVLLAPQGVSSAFVTDSSVAAWLRYIHAVQTFMQSENVTGAVELWNEPEQSDELWDDAALYYTTPPSNFSISNSGEALVVAASSLPAVSGVRLLNGWTDLSGASSLHNPAFSGYLPVTAAQLNSAFLGESLHPYGNNPEQQAWIPAAVQADAALGTQNMFTETPIGGQVGANFKTQPFYNALSSAGGGIRPAVTETGLAMGITSSETEVERTRFDMRQFLTMSGNNIYPIIFYKAGNDGPWEWFGEDVNHTPHPVVAAFTGLMSDINDISGAPVATYTSASLPQVASYTGYYPLATMSLVGSRSGDTKNSILFYSWQKTYTVPPAGTSENYGAAANWFSLASPASVPVSLSLPAGSAVSFVKDLVTGASVSYTVSGSSLTYAVADNPIEVLLTSGSTKADSVSVNSASAVYGSATVPVSAVVTYTAATVPTGAFTFTLNGTTATASCTVTSTTTENCAGSFGISSLAAGSYTLTGALAADSSYPAKSAAATVALTQASPTLVAANATVPALATAVTLNATVTYTGAVAPTGGVTFRVGTGTAATAQCVASGHQSICTAAYPTTSLAAAANMATVTLAADNNYSSVSSTATVTNGGSATVTVNNISTVFGTSSVNLTSSVAYTGSSPNGAILFQVNGGTAITAKCTGTASPLTCTAAYSPQALTPGTYAITAQMSGSTATIKGGTLTVTQATPVLSVAGENLSATKTSTTLFVNVTFSAATAPVGVASFSIDGGPPIAGRYSGSTTSPRTVIATASTIGLAVGRHTITATLPAETNYKAASATGTLIVSAPSGQ